uniref:Xylulose kinase-1 n=1 Tax=Tanacetum cinerariifolium TaxID=118510 RepID=A0A6L2JMJ9_TANCI|nr:hypothetical protein [Tanacetum cinerariifolium]
MTLTFAEIQNMIAYLSKSDASEGFNQTTNFLNGSSIKYALTLNPNIYLSCIKQFWTSVAVKKVNDVMRLQAQVDKKKVVITKATLRDALCLDDVKGRKFNFSKYIFDSLRRNVDSSTKFYMYPRFLQLMIRKKVGDLSSHTTKFSSLALTQKVFANMRRVGKGCYEVETPLFEGMIVEQQVDEGSEEVNVDDVPAVGVAAEGDVSAADDVVPTADKVAQALEITKLKQRVNKLERRNKASKLKRLKKVGSAQRIETSDDTIMDDVSKQGMMIIDIDADGMKAESRAQIYQIDLEHANKVLSMQDDDIEPTELQEVVEVVTTAKLITEVVTAASTTLTAVAPQLTTAVAPTITTAPIAARRIKGVVIKDPQETATPSTIIHSEAKSKDKGKGILVEEPKPLKKQAQIK